MVTTKTGKLNHRRGASKPVQRLYGREARIFRQRYPEVSLHMIHIFKPAIAYRARGALCQHSGRSP